MTLENDNLPTELRGKTINVVVIDMDPCICEQVDLNADGSYTMFLNSRHTYDTQKKGFWHAAGHIIRRDWDRSSVQEIEQMAHRH